MKTFIVLCLFLPSICFSQSGWNQQNSGVATDLLCVHFIDTSVGWTVGSAGVILKTTNGGNSWFSQQSGTTDYIMSVFFINQNYGWAGVGDGSILKTTNSGVLWTNPWGVSTDCRFIFFINVNTGWTSGYKSTNSGMSWQQQPGGGSSSASFISESIGWETGGTTVKTTNGGNTWVNQGNGGLSVFFTSATNGYVVGQGGYVRRTTNGGASWSTQILNQNNLWYSVFFADVNTGWVVGGLNEGFKTTNGGTNWFSTIMNSPQMLQSVCFVNNQTGWAVGRSGRIIKTTTGGIFTPNAPSLLIPTNGATGVSLTPLLDWSNVQYATTYGVQVSTTPNFSSILIDVANLSASQYTVTGGILSPSTSYYWHANASTANSTSLWSDTWSFTTSAAPPPPPVLISPPNGSTNQPLNPTFLWNSVPSADHYRLQLSASPTFNTQLIDTVVISTSFILSNGILSNSNSYYWHVLSIDSSVSGNWSATWSFTTSPIGIHMLSDKIPKEYVLYSNYPNPFNPETNIVFAIPKSSFVELEIYDILGREIETLVNQDLKPGIYKVNFNAFNLPSGVYFYKIITKNFVNTKKMILLK